MFRVLTLSAALAVGAVGPFPQVIKLPRGFQPEGIEVGRSTTFYVGSVATGAIYRGNLRTGAGAVLVRGGAGRPATGIELDERNRLFVAGASSGKAYVYNARTGALIRTYTFATSDTFINDVTLVASGAVFTDSRKAVFYHVPVAPNGALEDHHTIPIEGAFALAAGFNLNGIETSVRDDLIAVQSNKGKLFRIDSGTGESREIALGGQTMTNGDGLLLNGRTLYVVQNRENRVAVISLSANFLSGRVVRRLTDRDFDVPTTIDDLGRRLYAVNARFGTANPSSAAYQVVQLSKPTGR
jgi:outer membrane protein assembly factor BamB